MDVVILLVFISLVLVAAGLVFFVFRLRAGDFDHGERLALSPLHDDANPDLRRRGTEQQADEEASQNQDGGS